MVKIIIMKQTLEMKTLFKKGDKVKITRLEKKGYTDEGEVFSASSKEVGIKITQSPTQGAVGMEVRFGMRDGVWKYLNGNTYSKRDSGYSIAKI